MADGRVKHPSDLVERGQPVNVKILSIEGTRIGLSMKDISQDTDQDSAPQAVFGFGANMQVLGEGKNGHTNSGFQNFGQAKRERRRLTSPERWEIRHLIASGIAKVSDYPGLNEEYDTTLGETKLEEDFDVEVRHKEPPFLAGQTKQSLELSPIRVIKVPEGSMNRAAMTGATLAKERKELQKEDNAVTDENANIDLSAQWNGPMANPSKQKFASHSRNARTNNTKSDSIPEWKRVIKPKDESYGKRIHMPIKQQRESLPVFTFRQH